MPRLFLVQERIFPLTTVTLSREETNHLRVMRLKPGDCIYIADLSGFRYKAQIIEIGKGKAVLKVLRQDCLPQGLRPKIILGQAIPRLAKIEFILQKATELGVNYIYPLKTERSFLAKDKALSQNRSQRWERIVSEAAKQCGRTDLPVLLAPQTIDHFLEESLKADIKICLWEGENQGQGLRDFLRGLNKPESISILIGPEGSFSPNEIEKIRASGYQTLSCGPRIMRVETAAITCMAICQYEWGDL